MVLLGALAFFHIKAHIAALLGLASALLIAILAYKMPASMAVAAALNGAAYGLFPIGWIVLNAIFVYDITVSTGKFEVVKQTIAGLASDRRIQVLLDESEVSRAELPFEFMLNALRLTNGFAASLFTERTGLPITAISRQLDLAEARGLIVRDIKHVQPTDKGQLFLNDLLEIFLPESAEQKC